MKINEVTREAKKIIKSLLSMYTTYASINSGYDEMMKFIENNLTSTDKDVVREINIVVAKLQKDLIEILKK